MPVRDPGLPPSIPPRTYWYCGICGWRVGVREISAAAAAEDEGEDRTGGAVSILRMVLAPPKLDPFVLPVLTTM